MQKPYLLYGRLAINSFSSIYISDECLPCLSRNDWYLKTCFSFSRALPKIKPCLYWHTSPTQGPRSLAMFGFWDQLRILYTCWCFWGASDRLAPGSQWCLHLIHWHHVPSLCRQWSHESLPLFCSSELEFSAQLLWVPCSPLLHMLRSLLLGISKCKSIWVANTMLWIWNVPPGTSLENLAPSLLC